jgi:hypothetical protein
MLEIVTKHADIVYCVLGINNNMWTVSEGMAQKILCLIWENYLNYGEKNFTASSKVVYFSP